jgi:hypothetical protein
MESINIIVDEKCKYPQIKGDSLIIPSSLKELAEFSLDDIKKGLDKPENIIKRISDYQRMINFVERDSPIWEHLDEIIEIEKSKNEFGKISEIPCAICRGEVIEFSIPNYIWNKIMRSKSGGHEHDKDHICFDCFKKKFIEYIK